MHYAGSTSTAHVTGHSCRHTTITFGFLGGARSEEVQQMARHVSIDTTMDYNHHLERIDKAAEQRVDDVLRKAMAANDG